MSSYGYGDPETWPGPTGHPLDPRTEDYTILYERMHDDFDWEPCDNCEDFVPCYECVKDYLNR